MRTVGKSIVGSLSVLGVVAVATFFALPTGTNSERPSLAAQTTAASHAADSAESTHLAMEDARAKQPDRSASAPAPPPAPLPPVHVPSDVLITGDRPALTDRLPIDEPEPTAPTSRQADTTATALPRVAQDSPADSVRAAPNDSVRTRRVAERIAAIVSRAVSDPEASSAPSTNELPAARREPPRPSAFASAVAGTIPEDAADGPGITGLVTDETRTKVGRDFYDAFYDRWQSPDKNFYYTVVVSEQPMPSLGTRVVVRLNQNTVFQARLQPRSDLIEQAARRAVVLTQRRLQSNPTMNVY